ncbi:MAG: hypothetical protein HY077_07885 [Elusimicrobia bacterium]|nr:hypothetical protein [Elusimicrobiota bacterium]
MKDLKSPLLLLSALIAGNAWLWTEFLQYSQNTLLLNGRWISTKRTFEMGVMGSDSFLLSRQALHHNRLNLAAWYGCNEVLWRRPFKPRGIVFDFKVEPGAELSVVFNKTEQGFSGLRLSANPDHEGVFFRASPDGGFASSRRLAPQRLPGRWHRLELAFDAGRLQAALDGQPIASVQEAAEAGQLFGFRGGFGGASVDNVFIKDADGRTETEDFLNRKGERRILALNAAALLLLCGLAFAPPAWRKNQPRSTALGLAAANLVLLGAGASFFLFDYCCWSGLQVDSLSRPLFGPKPAEFYQTVEGVRSRIFSVWRHGIMGKMAGDARSFPPEYPGRRIWDGPIFCGRDPAAPPAVLTPPMFEELAARRKTAYRILFVGSSQTIGSGAQRLSETFFARTHRSLAASFGPKIPIESLNIAVSGTNASQLFVAYQRTYLRFKPDLVVINFSVNGNLEQLTSGISKFLRENRSKGIATILLKEAMARGFRWRGPRPRGMSRSGPRREIDPYHNEGPAARRRILEIEARAYGTPIYDLNGHLNDPRIDSTGFLWWDSAHLSSYGQAVVANWLAPILIQSIKHGHSARF